MKEASRIQAIIEILADVVDDKLPADVLLDKYFKQRRYIGSKDRRFIADCVWQIIRYRSHYQEMLGDDFNSRLAVALHFRQQDLELLFNGEEYAPAQLTKDERQLIEKAKKFTDFSVETDYECPKWLYDKFADKKLLEALNETAPLDVRANLTSREQAQNRLKKEGLFFAPTPFSPIGLRSNERINLNNCMTYQDGEIEVMDEGSQLMSLLCRVKPHHKVIDYCAGAGGKSLAIGAQMHNDGVIWAHDISWERLSRIKKRAERLDILNIKLIQEVKDDDYDRFIIDAPCSGSGTWRRSPDAKYRLTPEKLKKICQTQAELLEYGAKHTKSGGWLIYMTCSVFKEENEAQIQEFLSHHSDFCCLNHRELWQETLDIQLFMFENENWLKFNPLNIGTDGFFFCAMRKNQE